MILFNKHNFQIRTNIFKYIYLLRYKKVLLYVQHNIGKLSDIYHGLVERSAGLWVLGGGRSAWALGF